MSSALDLADTGSATTLPAILDFDKDRDASPRRMNAAMTYLYLRLAAATALQPEFESAIAELQAVGLDRLNEVLTPIFVKSTGIAAQLDALVAAWLTGAPLTQLLNDLDARVTAKLGSVDAQLAASLAAVTAQLAANLAAVTAQSDASRIAAASATTAADAAATQLAKPRAIAFSVLGKPIASQLLARFALPFAMTINPASCGGIASAAANAQWVLTLKRNGVAVATWTWNAGATAPVINVITANNAAGAYTLEAPATPDSTLTDPSPTLGFTL